MSNELKKQMLHFILHNQYLSEVTIAELVGVNKSVFISWLYGNNKNLHINQSIENFLMNDAKRLTEIHECLKVNTADRILFHRKRVEILKKARIHLPEKQRVPSPRTLTV